MGRAPGTRGARPQGHQGQQSRVLLKPIKRNTRENSRRISQARRQMAHGRRQRLGLGTHQQLLQVVSRHRTRSQPQRPNQTAESPSPRRQTRRRIAVASSFLRDSHFWLSGLPALLDFLLSALLCASVSLWQIPLFLRLGAFRLFPYIVISLLHYFPASMLLSCSSLAPSIPSPPSTTPPLKSSRAAPTPSPK